MRKKKHKQVVNYPYKKQGHTTEKLYGYIIDVDEVITSKPEPVTEDIDYVEIIDLPKLLSDGK